MWADSKIVYFFKFGLTVQKLFNVEIRRPTPFFHMKNLKVVLNNFWTVKPNFKNPTILESDHMRQELYYFKLFYAFKSLIPSLTKKTLYICILNFFQGNWYDANKFCSKLGMSAITVQNMEKLDCLYDAFGKKFNIF